MNNLTVNIPNITFRLNLTDHLAETKKMIQTGHFYNMKWSEICDLFVSYFKTNFRDVKDTSGVSFGEFKKYSLKEWRLKLYTEYLDLDEKLSNSNISTEKRSKLEFKWDKINTEKKRLDVLNDLFPHGIDNGFHRLAIDCINKSAIIIDYDNSEFIKSLNKKTGKLELIRHNLYPVQPDFIMEKLSHLFCNYIIYSSFSSSENLPKFRVILPLDVSVDRKEIDKIKECIINLLSNSVTISDFTHNLIDYTSFEMSRFFYMPVNHIDKFDDSTKITCTNQSKFKINDCWIAYRNSDNYLSTNLLHEFRFKSLKKSPDSWKGIEYIDTVRKNFSHN